MTLSQIVLSSADIDERPVCATCGMPMWLSRINPHDADHDERIFECGTCELSKLAAMVRSQR
ncbi:MAG: hypothetical protein WDN48_11725 [Pseudolabrys sp.]